MKSLITTIVLLAAAVVAGAQENYVSKVWVADQGDGTYRNPVLNADYSDPDVCRVGEDYYMTSSSFNCLPGLPILHSRDMVNWTLINHALTKQIPSDDVEVPAVKFVTGRFQNGGVWAPAIRYHDGEFYIFYGDPDYGVFMLKTKDIRGRWEKPVWVMEGRGIIDPAPLWDDDGSLYMVYGIAGSRMTNRSLICMVPLSADGTRTLCEPKVVYDGHETQPTIEGPKLYKRNGWYYIFAPAGGVPTGWQTVLRSRSIWGPYEEKIVLATGSTKINGPHQGAWVDTPDGKEHWFFHFQENVPYGRVVHLQPMRWVDDWPVIGEDKDGDGCGEPVARWKKPGVGKTYPIATPVESDEFSSRDMGLQWQWHTTPNPIWAYFAGEKGYARLYSVVPPVRNKYGNLLDIPNLFLQKLPAEEFSATAKFTFKPHAANTLGERAGFIVMGFAYTVLSVENKDGGFVITQSTCADADKGGKEVVQGSAKVASDTFYFRLDMAPGGLCSFLYSTDGRKYTPIGTQFAVAKARGTGAKMGLFCNRNEDSIDAGWIDVDYFRVEKLRK